MSVFFDQPAWMLLGLLAVPLTILGLRTLRGFDRARRVTAVGFRGGLLILLAVILAGPHYRREHDAVTVIGLLDISGSVQRFAPIPEDEGSRRSYLAHTRQWFLDAIEDRAPDDRFGLVVFDGAALAVLAPSRVVGTLDHLDVSSRPGTRIEEAIRLGLAMFPADAARRFVLVTDGNETGGDALEAARHAAADANVPIDVVPIVYSVTNDAQIVVLETPATARPGQTITVRIITEATEATPVRLTLRAEGEPVDLNGERPGRSRRIVLPKGRSVHLAEVRLQDTPVNRFVATIEPVAGGLDALADNNQAEAVVSTPARGKILIVDRDPGPHPLARRLEAADLPATVAGPAALPHDLLALQNFDLIVLDNIPAYDLSPEQHGLLARYVHDLGGGLIVVGGPQSLGAGGWNNSALEPVLPLELDPPRELRLPRAALVLVLDQSGSMNEPVAGARATQQEVANEAAARAIESLRGDSLVGVITFHAFARVLVPLQRNDDPAAIASKVRTISAGGGTNLEPALRKALEMLQGVEVERKRIVCLSDGRSPKSDLDTIARRMKDQGIALTTIAIGDDADHETLERLAELGGGDFYPVYNVKGLPRVLIDSVQSINKPLIKEGEFQPVVLPLGDTLTARMTRAPVLGGLIVTAPREDPRAVIAMTHPDGEPLLAWWQAGLGRTAVFTSDLDGPWSSSWSAWEPGAAFWVELVRRTARPPVNQEAELIATIQDGRLLMTLEAIDETRGYLDYLDVAGTVYRPDGTSRVVRLQQTAAGRYEGATNADLAGSYIIALNPRRGQRQLAPVIGGVNRPTGEEFRRYESDLDLLEGILTATGGRGLDLADPVALNVFDRTGLPRSVALLPLWPWLLAAALAIWLLDIATRRLAWSTAAIVRVVRRAAVWVTPGARGHAAAATLASLRDVASTAETRGAAAQVPSPRTAGPQPVARETRPAEPKTITAALDRFRRRSTDDEETPAPNDPAPEQDADDVRDTTSSLFEAKRRARARMEDRSDRSE